MITSTNRRINHLQYAATLLGALAVLALAPATAHATDDNQPTGSDGGHCNHTDADGYDIPIDNGSDVIVDGTIVSCRDGKIIITTAPKRAVDNVGPQIMNPNLSVFNGQPQLQTPMVPGNRPASRTP